ncbi:hypothetical protein [Fodinicola acaciae]|uniref:hypothetical protein n=1 Tax=Fodinicola acaciae TaxID=2681555 RepID=UPI0013CF8F9A|nr:hypothetical protein [Fodinicola acaciae]
MNWTLLAAVAAMAMLTWEIVTEWVPMYPLNDLSAQPTRLRLIAAAANYPVMAAIAVLFAVGNVVTTLIGAGLCLVVLGGHLRSWWIPYLTGRASASWQVHYERDYQRTLKLLPRRPYMPDAQHMVVGLIAVAMVVTGVAASVQVL